MIYRTLNFVDGIVTAEAQGHADEVIKSFHSVCTSLLAPHGAWRFAIIVGTCPLQAEKDSDMKWDLIAKLK